LRCGDLIPVVFGRRELDSGPARLGAVGGLPTAAEMIEHYGKFSDRDLSVVPWYTVLACFKLGIVLEGTHARAFAGKAPKQVGDFLHAITLELFERAHGLME
jgi:aminoglycoside phosphotransferase (APT) family kinase protein